LRKLTGYAGLVVGAVGVVMSLYHVYARLTPAAPDSLALRIIALAFCLTLSFLLFPARAAAPLDEDGTRLYSEGGFASHPPRRPPPTPPPGWLARAKPALGQ